MIKNCTRTYYFKYHMKYINSMAMINDLVKNISSRQMCIYTNIKLENVIERFGRNLGANRRPEFIL